MVKEKEEGGEVEEGEKKREKWWGGMRSLLKMFLASKLNPLLAMLK